MTTIKQNEKKNAKSLPKRPNYRWSVLFILAIFIGINFISSFLHFRLDVTKDQLYTLTEGTRSILQKIETPLTIKYFFSYNHKQTPQTIKNYGNNVREILEEYERENPSAITLEIINPVPDSDDEEWANRYGIQAIQDFSVTEYYYMGMVIVNEDRETVIPFMDPRNERSLEYDISKAIHEVTKSDSFTVGVYTSLPLEGSPANPYLQQQATPPWVFYTELEKLYKTEIISPTDAKEIPENIDLLIVVHPKQISDGSEYALDQFLMRGGNMIVLVDPNMATDIPTGGRTGNISSSALGKLFSTWGIRYDASKIVGDMDLATTVQPTNSPPVPFGLWLTYNDRGINRSMQIMSDIKNLFFPYAGGFTFESGNDDIEFIPLISTTENAGLVDGFVTGYMPPAEINKQLAGDKQYTVAGILTGRFNSAYAAAPETPSDVEEAKKITYVHPHKNKSETGGSVIVIADVDFIHNRFSVSQQNLFGNTVTFYRNNNLPMILNLIDFVSGSTDLIGIRSRGNFLRTFTLFEDMRKSAQEKYNTAEEGLKSELTLVEQKLNQLQPKSDSGEIQLSKDIVEQINQFKDKQLETKQQLRQIRSLLRKDIEFLKNILIMINLFLIPLAVMGFGITVYYRRTSVA